MHLKQLCRRIGLALASGLVVSAASATTVNVAFVEKSSTELEVNLLGGIFSPSSNVLQGSGNHWIVLLNILNPISSDFVSQEASWAEPPSEPGKWNTMTARCNDTENPGKCKFEIRSDVGTPIGSTWANGQILVFQSVDRNGSTTGPNSWGFTLSFTDNGDGARVPEPGALSLLGLSLAALAWTRRRRG